MAGVTLPHHKVVSLDFVKMIVSEDAVQNLITNLDFITDNTPPIQFPTNVHHRHSYMFNGLLTSLAWLGHCSWNVQVEEAVRQAGASRNANGRSRTTTRRVRSALSQVAPSVSYMHLLATRPATRNIHYHFVTRCGPRRSFRGRASSASCLCFQSLPHRV